MVSPTWKVRAPPNQRRRAPRFQPPGPVISTGAPGATPVRTSVDVDSKGATSTPSSKRLAEILPVVQDPMPAGAAGDPQSVRERRGQLLSRHAAGDAHDVRHAGVGFDETETAVATFEVDRDLVARWIVDEDQIHCFATAGPQLDIDEGGAQIPKPCTQLIRTWKQPHDPEAPDFVRDHGPPARKDIHRRVGGGLLRPAPVTVPTTDTPP